MRDAVAAAVGLKLLLSVALLRHGFVSVSGDDFFRALIALEWAKRPFLVTTEFDTASSLWLPLPFWINGAVLRLIPEPWLVPIAVNVAFSLGGLLYLFGIGRRLFDAQTGLLAFVLVGILPWHVWLSISGMAEIPLLFFLSAAFYYVVRWETDPRTSWALPVALGALGATATRPEGWLYAVPLTIRFAIAATAGSRWGLLVAAVIPWGFAASWLAFNYVAYGEAWHFVQLSRQNFQTEAGRVDSVAIRLLQFPLLMLGVSPTLTLLLFPGIARACRDASSAVRRVTVLAVSGLALLVVAGLLGLGTTSTPQRYVVAPLALLTPLIAGWCRQVAWPALGSRLATLGLLAFVVGNTLFAFQFSLEFLDEVRVARTLSAMRARGLLDSDALVASDRLIAAAGPPGALTPERRVRFLVDRWALQVLSGMPEAFADRGWSTELPSGAPGDRVRVIALKTPDLVPFLPPGFAQVGAVGAYRLYAAGIRREQVPPALPLAPTSQIPAEFGRLVRFEGYQQDGWAAPRVVRLVFDWAQSEARAEPVTAEVRLLREGSPVAIRTYVLAGHLPPGPRPGPIEVPVRFGEDFDVRAGRYFLGVALRNGAGVLLPVRGPGASAHELVLGPFYLIRSKREVLKEVVATWRMDPSLVARVLLSL